MTNLSNEMRVYRAAVQKFGLNKVADTQGISITTAQRYVNGYNTPANTKTVPQAAFNTALYLLTTKR